MLYASNIYANKWSELPAVNTPSQGYNNFDISYTRVALIFDKNHADAEGWTDADPAGKIVNNGDNVGALPANPSRTDYKFVNWNPAKDGSGTAVTTSTKVNSNRELTFYAKWQRTAPCTVVFDKNHNDTDGFSEADPAGISGITVGKTTGKLPLTPERFGYIFDGWNTAKDGKGLAFTPSTAINDNLTVYAMWKPVNYTIIFDANGGEGVSEVQALLHIGDNIIFPDSFEMEDHYVYGFDTSKDADECAYTGKGFVLDAAAINDIFTENSSYIGVLYAIWVESPVYTVAYQPGKHGTFKMQTYDHIKYGQPTPEAHSISGEDGWVFAGWSPEPSDIVTNDAEYEAQWELHGSSANVTTSDSAQTDTAPGDSADTTTDTSVSTEPASTQPSDASNSGVSQTNGTLKTGGGGLTPAAVLEILKEDGVPGITIGASEVPLFGITNLPVWAVLNLLLGLSGVILAAIAAIRMAVRKKEQYGTPNKLWLVITVILAAAGIAFFLFTQNMNNLMVLVDNWTIAHVIIFVALLSSTRSMLQKEKEGDFADNNSDMNTI
jgi:uncharacterized repeat protein (TIGR02543 family)